MRALMPIRSPGRLSRLVAGAVALVVVVLALSDSSAQRRQPRPLATPVPEAPAQPPPPALHAPAQPPPPAPLARETVQADVSTRRVAVTSSFSGTGIVVFGAVDNSRQESAEAGLYDVVIVVSGTPSKLVARRKSKVAGIWINTASVGFESVPSYYAITSTRPIEEVASEEVLKASGIGFEFVPMAFGSAAQTLSQAEIKEWREAVVRLKQRDRLYQKDEYGVAFVGRSLFRATIDMPANVTVGPFETRVFLFRNGELLSRYTARFNLEREGLESLIHRFAFEYSLFYGIFCVLVAVGAGMLASYVFSRSAH